MSQIVYDYICLSLPLQRVHEEGECNPEVMARLSGEESPAANPFKGMLKISFILTRK